MLYFLSYSLWGFLFVSLVVLSEGSKITCVNKSFYKLCWKFYLFFYKNYLRFNEKTS